MYVTDKALSDAIDWLLHQDFSVFHREQLYDSRENGIVNMVINKQVFPDIVLMPVVGAHSPYVAGDRRKTKRYTGKIYIPCIYKTGFERYGCSCGRLLSGWQLCKKFREITGMLFLKGHLHQNIMIISSFIRKTVICQTRQKKR